jgi:nitrilase
MERPSCQDELLKIGAVQPRLRKDYEDPIDYTENYMIPLLISNRGADLYILPELAPLGYTQHTFDTYLESESIHKHLDKALSTAARELKAFIAYGCVGQGNEKKCIQHRVIDDQGKIVAKYNKQLLCNYGDCSETTYFEAGSNSTSFEIKGFRLGMLICADMRIPSWTRHLVVRENVDAILQPAAFSRDLSFRTWKSFRETRAVENSIYWVGVNYSGDCYGNTTLVSPWVDEDNEPITMGTREGVLIGTLDKKLLKDVRTRVPYYREVMKERETDDKNH